MTPSLPISQDVGAVQAMTSQPSSPGDALSDDEMKSGFEAAMTADGYECPDRNTNGGYLYKQDQDRWIGYRAAILASQPPVAQEPASRIEAEAAAFRWLIANRVVEDDGGWLQLRYSTARQGKDHPDKQWVANDIAWEAGLDLDALAPPTPAQGLSDAARDVLTERQRQINAEGWTPDHDDEHDRGELAVAAALYALRRKADPLLWITSGDRPNANARFLESVREWVKPCDTRRSLVKAGALILAELERLDRAAILSANRATQSPEAP